MLFVIIIVSMIAPGVALIVWVRKRKTAEDPANWGFLSGLLPMLVSAFWYLYFILRYRGGYSFDEMQRMEVYNILVFVLLPILVPIFANLLWKRSLQPLMLKRLGLVFAFSLLFVMYFQMPLTWDFTFVLFPFSLFFMLLGFCFLRRKDPEISVVQNS